MCSFFFHGVFCSRMPSWNSVIPMANVLSNYLHFNMVNKAKTNSKIFKPSQAVQGDNEIQNFPPKRTSESNLDGTITQLVVVFGEGWFSSPENGSEQQCVFFVGRYWPGPRGRMSESVLPWPATDGQFHHNQFHLSSHWQYCRLCHVFWWCFPFDSVDLLLSKLQKIHMLISGWICVWSVSFRPEEDRMDLHLLHLYGFPPLMDPWTVTPNGGSSWQWQKEHQERAFVTIPDYFFCSAPILFEISAEISSWHAPQCHVSNVAFLFGQIRRTLNVCLV